MYQLAKKGKLNRVEDNASLNKSVFRVLIELQDWLFYRLHRQLAPQQHFQNDLKSFLLLTSEMVAEHSLLVSALTNT